MWKAAVVSDPNEAVRCLERALRLNPNNQRARVGLEWAYKRQKAENETPPTQEAGPTRANFSARPPTEAVPLRNSSPNQPEGETKAGPAPYKKSRLSETAVHLPSVKLPPEALPWTRANRQPSTRSAPTVPVSNSSDATANSKVFKAANPRVAFTVAPQVAEARHSVRKIPFLTGSVPLRWPLGLFGLALGLAVLSFILTGLAPLLGVVALLAAIAGVILFNRARF